MRRLPAFPRSSFTRSLTPGIARPAAAIGRTAIAIAAVVIPVGTATAQFGGGAGGGAGVVIDPQGVLRLETTQDDGGRLAAERRKAAVASLPGELKAKSPLRKVALGRLERELAGAVKSGHGVPEAMRMLAGLTRVRYVFVYPEDGDRPGEVVIAGPAEGWATDGFGRTTGIETGSPTVLLEDLAAAIRAFPPGQPTDRLLGCSIDPTEQGLAAMQRFVNDTGRVNPGIGPDDIVAGLRDSLGPQVVSVQGVSPATHFARVLVEADYRMKLIAIGLEPPPVKMTSFIDLAAASSVAANALKRWYFVPELKCVRPSGDDLAIELVGRGVKLCGADEVVLAGGKRMGADRPDKASESFTQAFTKKYPDIAARSPVFAQLRNLIDLSVAAAYLQEQDAYGCTGWEAATLRDEAAYPIETLPAPKQVDPAINAVWRGARLLTPIGGGVVIHPRLSLDPPNLLADEGAAVEKARVTAADLPANRWWWD
jgi:hypothetical protein